MSNDEPEGPARRAFHSGAIFGAALLVVVLLYVLSPIPVSFALNRSHAGIPPAVPRFYAPFHWAHDHTPLSRPIDAYAMFVSRLGR